MVMRVKTFFRRPSLSDMACEGLDVRPDRNIFLFDMIFVFHNAILLSDLGLMLLPCHGLIIYWVQRVNLLSVKPNCYLIFGGS